MKIGIIGCGVVGTATLEGLRVLGHELVCHDPKLNSDLTVVLSTDISFICVPSPSLPNGVCDTSIIEETVHALTDLNYQGVIAIKSTVSPGTTQRLIDQYQNSNICFVPEFLKERSALEDFVSNHAVLAVGCTNDGVWDCVCSAHAWLPAHSARMTPTEAEILKYYSNTFAALKVTFANVMYEVCKKFGSSYDTILNAYLLRNVSGSDYLECNPEMRGYGGMCLPKDINAMAELCSKIGLPFKLFETIAQDNSLVKQTIFPGMRNGPKQ